MSGTYTFLPEQRTNWDRWCFYEGAFTKEECLKIRSLFGVNLEIAKVGGENSTGVEDKTIRDSKIKFITWEHDLSWIYEKLQAFVIDANKARYGFDLMGFMEGLQLTRYSEKGHYDWHQDSGVGPFSIRKLSVVVQLSEPEEYEGGELEFFKGGQVKKSQGTLAVFPSFEMHKVLPVTSGVRHSLVGWVSGQPFR
jgi:PKHD-type hydroxylase